MSDRTARDLHHLSLALAGVCLTVAELPFLPWLPVALVVYLSLVLLAHSLRGAYVLPAWLANVLAVLIAGGTATWVFFRGSSEAWGGDLPLPAVLVPFLGPVLMALLCVRLFRPRSRDDFWLLQGLGLLQVALGCVLASGTLFGIALFAYVITGLSALAAHERQRRGRRSSAVSGPPRPPEESWLRFGLGWAVRVTLLAVPLFLLTPRTNQPDWDPLSRFGLRQSRNTVARTGFSEEIDLSRTGALTPDETPAFWVEVRTRAGRLLDALPPDPRFRGIVLDRYEDGVWRSELTWPTAVAGRLRPRLYVPGEAALTCRFTVPRRTGGLFLLDPLARSATPGELPVRPLGEAAAGSPIFFDQGGAAVPLTFLTLNEYRYEQFFLPDVARDRGTTPPLRDAYLVRLLRANVPGLESWSRALLLRAARNHPDLLRAVRDSGDDLPPRWWALAARVLGDHLARSGEYGYSLESRRQDTSRDPTMDFLVNVRQGPCERYASALALILRSLGVPARIVKGYNGAEHLSTGRYLVRQSQAHAWVEVLVPAEPGSDPPAYEWLTVDPTPSTETAVSGLVRWLQTQQRGGQELWTELIVGYNAQQQARVLESILSGEAILALLPWLSAGLAVVIAGLLARHLLRRAWRPGRAPGTAALLERLRQVLSPDRLTAANQTPGELAEQARSWLTAQGLAEVAGVPAKVVGLYYRARYGGVPASDEEMRQAATRLDELEKALAGLPVNADAGAASG